MGERLIDVDRVARYFEKGSCNKTDRAVREWATSIVEDPQVQARLLADRGLVNSIHRS